MTKGRPKAIFRSMDRRKFGDFHIRAWMEGLKASGDSSFFDDVTIFHHYSPALTRA